MKRHLAERRMKQIKMVDDEPEAPAQRMCRCCGKRPVAGYVSGPGGIYLDNLCIHCWRSRQAGGRDEAGESYHRGARSAKS